MFNAMVQAYREAGASEIPRSTYQVSSNGRYLVCTGYRGLYRQAKRDWLEIRRGSTPGRPDMSDKARARKRAARARRREAPSGQQGGRHERG